MNRVLVGNGGQGAQCLLLHHDRAPISGVRLRPSVPNVRIRAQFDPLSCKPRKPSSSTRLCASASSLFTSSTTGVASATAANASAAAAAAAAAASTATKRIGFLGWYLAMIETHPIWTKSITAAAIFGAADVCSQLGTQSSRGRYDFVRTLRMASYGMIVLGPVLHCWFNFVSIILPKQDLASTLMKMVLAQTTFGPFMTCVFFSTNALLQGESVREIIARLRRDLIPTMMRGFTYWPLCDFITFRFVPVDLQPLICNWFSFFWTIYLTYMASRKKVVVPPEDPASTSFLENKGSTKTN